MKHKIIALLSALALCVSMAGCTISTPASVGKIGDVEITSGIYLISQFQAYQTVLGFASAEQAELSPSEFAKETVYLAEDGTKAPTPAEGETQTGEARAVSAFIDEEITKNLEYYAAVETMFAELGGVLSETELATAKSYTEQLWESNGALYEKNGIGKNTVSAYQEAAMKANALLTLIYGEEGTEAVSDAELTSHLENEMVYGQYYAVPMYNTMDYTFADETQQAEILNALTDAVDDYTKVAAAGGGDSYTGTPDFMTALQNHLSDAYAVMGNEFNTSMLETEMGAQLFSAGTLSSNFSVETAETIANLGYNQAAAFHADITSAMAFLRIDPLTNSNIDALRASVLADYKGDALSTSIEENGAALAKTLDASAVGKFPLRKVIAE